MHDYPSYPCSTTLCPGTSLFSEKEYTRISFEYVTGPVIHNKYMSMKTIYRVNDDEIPPKTTSSDTGVLEHKQVDDCH